MKVDQSSHGVAASEGADDMQRELSWKEMMARAAAADSSDSEDEEMPQQDQNTARTVFR